VRLWICVGEQRLRQGAWRAWAGTGTGTILIRGQGRGDGDRDREGCVRWLGRGSAHWAPVAGVHLGRGACGSRPWARLRATLWALAAGMGVGCLLVRSAWSSLSQWRCSGPDLQFGAASPGGQLQAGSTPRLVLPANQPLDCCCCCCHILRVVPISLLVCSARMAETCVSTAIQTRSGARGAQSSAGSTRRGSACR